MYFYDIFLVFIIKAFKYESLYSLYSLFLTFSPCVMETMLALGLGMGLES